MSRFPKPGPRTRVPDGPFQELGKQILAEDQAAARALTAHVARASRGRPRNPSPTPSPSPTPPPPLPELSAIPRQLRKHANAKYEKEDRRFDTTALHYDLHGKQISHADYIAHCEKYDYAWRSIKKGDRILDVGCGTDLPLLKAINYVQAQATKILYSVGGCYVGVDLNPLKATGMNWGETIGELDMTSEEGYDRALAAVPGNAAILAAQGMTKRDLAKLDPEDSERIAADAELPLRGYTMIVCLEVIEHMPPEDGRRLLENFRDLLSPDGRVILSTPVYDGKAMARNHIHEYFIPELQEMIESVGLVVSRRLGTFTAEPQLKSHLKKIGRLDLLAMYEEAREFHSSGYMSGVLAPMFPDVARNNVWILTPPGDG